MEISESDKKSTEEKIAYLWFSKGEEYYNLKCYEEAIKCFFNAAEYGNTDAMIKIAEAYVTGDGVPIDFEQAIAWMEKARDAGSEKAAAIIEIVKLYNKKYR